MASAAACVRLAARQVLVASSSGRGLLVSRARASAAVFAGQATAAPLARRSFASAASGKVSKALAAEVGHEEEQYEQAKEIKAFLKTSPFKFVEVPGDVNMILEREVGDRTVRIEWQLTSPFDPAGDVEGAEDEAISEATDLSVSVESKTDGSGLIFYCSTVAGEDHRYVIGNVKVFASAEEKDGISSYNGPEFEDLDDKVQEAFDEYLAELGMSTEVCDFIDAMAVDKEQREYVRWLKTGKTFLSE